LLDGQGGATIQLHFDAAMTHASFVFDTPRPGWPELGDEEVPERLARVALGQVHQKCYFDTFALPRALDLSILPWTGELEHERCGGATLGWNGSGASTTAFERLNPAPPRRA
jgi:hypothetical protein